MITGGVFDPQGPGYGNLATKNEGQRQAMINQGLAQINAIFGGGNASFYSMANANGSKYNPQQGYYYLNQKGFVPYAPTQAPANKWDAGRIAGNSVSSLLSPGVGSSLANAANGDAGGAVAGLLTNGLSDLGGALSSLFGGAPETQQEHATKLFNRGNLLNKQDASFQGYGEDFFNQRAKDYVNYALPQEAQQFKTNQDAITYDLADRGILDSSIAKNSYSNLERTANQAKQTIADSAIAQSNQLRSGVESVRQNAIQQLYQTGDPNLAAHNAISAAQSIGQPSVFAPIGNMFGNLASQYYTNQLLNSYKNQGSGVMPQGSPYYNLSGALPSQ